MKESRGLLYVLDFISLHVLLDCFLNIRYLSSRLFGGDARRRTTWNRSKLLQLSLIKRALDKERTHTSTFIHSCHDGPQQSQKKLSTMPVPTTSLSSLSISSTGDSNAKFSSFPSPCTNKAARIHQPGTGKLHQCKWD